MAPTAQIVKSGTWLYDETVPYDVWIVSQSFDFCYDEGFEDGPEVLNNEGVLFHVLIARGGKVGTVLSAVYSIAEATAKAHRAIPQGIEWDNHILQPLFGGREYRLSE